MSQSINARMVEQHIHPRRRPIRQPLSDLSNWSNIDQRKPDKHSKSRPNKHTDHIASQALPHNESLVPNGTLAVRGSQQGSPESRRVSQLVDEHQHDSKRSSAISTASTSASGGKRKAYIGPWQLGKTIGKGGCSRVRAVRHRYRDQKGAVKIISRHMAETTRAQSLANLVDSVHGASSSTSTLAHRPIPWGLGREIAVMKLLEHPNIVRLYDVWENRNELYLIMEYVPGGELFHYVDERKGLEEPETVLIFRQIVSALLYCHRLLICHRDLKPENILLDRRTLDVKLIDFGMAALQPEGRLLSTPCGSPHYAAPEVVSSKPYDGTQADVWSCGVILYVMLTGTTPFNYPINGDIRALFRDIGRAKYYMPEDLSLEAQDLVRRIFVPDPRTRITMDGIWDHPLLHKYDAVLQLDGPQGSKEAAIGPIPRIEEWQVNKAEDIDREILGNMRILWHSDTEQMLVQKLLNREHNQEKMFYAALIKHREENLENFMGNTDDMGHSTSDYHHSKPPDGIDGLSSPGSKALRSQSQYSIMNDEHLRPSHSFVEPSPSVGSYDPYRASRSPIVKSSREYLNITVLRQSSASTNKTSVVRGLRHPGAKRIEPLKYARRPSAASLASLQRSSRSKSSMPRSSLSRGSMVSSQWPSSPPVIASMRPSDLHKRGVSFHHLRRMSTRSVLVSTESHVKEASLTPGVRAKAQEIHVRSPSSAKKLATSSPSALADQKLKSRKENRVDSGMPKISVKPSGTPIQHISSEVRKHSAELEKACEQAFFHCSVGSDLTVQTSTTDKHSSLDTPPTSITGPETPETAPRTVTKGHLSTLSRDTPNTYLTKTLEETRHKLAAYKANPDESTAKFEEVLKMLESIMPGAGASADRRTASSPQAKTAVQPIQLPTSFVEDDGHESQDTHNRHRSLTTPTIAEMPGDRTVRMVPPSPPEAVAPLSIRKRKISTSSFERSQSPPGLAQTRVAVSSQRGELVLHGLESIAEDSALQTPVLIRKKRSGWFGLNKKGTDSDWLAAEDSSPAASELAMQSIHQHGPVSRDQGHGINLSDGPPLSPQSSEFPIRKVRLQAGRKGLARWIGRIARDRGQDSSNMIEGDTTVRTARSLDSLFSTISPSSLDDQQDIGPERSWFARFFHIKPTVQVLCFTIPRARVRQELVIVLREWERYGVRDLQYSRETNTISFSVDKRNKLEIKPVTLRVELFVVLEHGRKSGLSIARFTQLKGAASGFRRVLDVVDGVMRGRGWLVEDRDKWRALCEVIGG